MVERHLAKVNVASSNLVFRSNYAGVVELADALDSKSSGGDIVWVRLPPPAPEKPPIFKAAVFQLNPSADGINTAIADEICYADEIACGG